MTRRLRLRVTFAIMFAVILAIAGWLAVQAFNCIAGGVLMWAKDRRKA